MSTNYSLHGQRVTVMGLGQFGGGAGAVTFLLQRGARVTLTDLQSETQLADVLTQIDTARLERLVLGRHEEADFETADLVVVNPAVPPHRNRFLEAARGAGVPLTSEIALFWQFCRGRIIGVTGTVGKSTTATLIYQLLRETGTSSRLGGNIGISLLPDVDQIQSDEWIVLELSSFQLQSLRSHHARANVAVVTNFSPNHLDWHADLNEYRAAKQTLLAGQHSDDVAILNADDPGVSGWPTLGKIAWFGRNLSSNASGVLLTENALVVKSPEREREFPFRELAADLRAPHVRYNLAAALAAVTFGARLPVPGQSETLKHYESLPHRLETVGHVAGRTFINDSKATTPEAAIEALGAGEIPMILIAGGKDKGGDLSTFAAKIAERAKCVVLIGPTAATLQQQIHAVPSQTIVTCAGTFADALHQAWEASCPGDTILLSPGCASHAEFLNYEDRGRQFRAFAEQLEMKERPKR